MTIKERVNPNEDTVAIGGGATAAGAVGCAVKYGAVKVAEGGAAMLATAAGNFPVIKLGVSVGTFLGEILCPEIAIIGGLVILGASLFEVEK